MTLWLNSQSPLATRITSLRPRFRPTRQTVASWGLGEWRAGARNVSCGLLALPMKNETWPVRILAAQETLAERSVHVARSREKKRDRNKRLPPLIEARLRAWRETLRDSDGQRLVVRLGWAGLSESALPQLLSTSLPGRAQKRCPAAQEWPEQKALFEAVCTASRAAARGAAKEGGRPHPGVTEFCALFADYAIGLLREKCADVSE